MTRCILTAFAAAAALGTASLAWADEPIVLKYGDPGPPNASIHTDAIVPWSNLIAKESGGAVKAQIFNGPSLVSMVNAYDRVANGVADVAFCILGPISSQVPKTTVATLPFETRSAHEAGLALQRLYEKGIIADEWQKVKPIAFGVFANLAYHSVPRIDKLEDLKGVKISVQGRIAAQTAEALGATPITMPVTQLYQSLQRGLIQAVAIGWPATVTFKTIDIVRHHVNESLGGAGANMIMNKASYARLSGKAKKAVDDHIGTWYTNLFNKVIDDTERDNIQIVKNMKNQEMHKLAPDELKRWQVRMRPVISNWVKATPDGERVLSAFRKEIADIRAGS